MSTTQSILEAGCTAVRSRCRREAEEEWELGMTVHGYGVSLQDADDTVCVLSRFSRDWLFTTLWLQPARLNVDSGDACATLNFLKATELYTLNDWILWDVNYILLVAQTVKNLPAVQETQVRSLDLEDPLEKGMATHSSILAWEVPWTEAWRATLQSMGSQSVSHDWASNTFPFKAA